MDIISLLSDFSYFNIKKARYIAPDGYIREDGKAKWENSLCRMGEKKIFHLVLQMLLSNYFFLQ